MATYEEAMEGFEVTRAEARREVVQQHGMLWEDFVADCGEKDCYMSDEVLAWLGY